MSRYHLNPETGNPNKCHAKRRCPFGDLEKDHFDTPAAARSAFEGRKSVELFKSFSVKNNNNGVITKGRLNEISSDITSEELRVFLKDKLVKDVTVGRISEDDSYREEFESYQKAADSLISIFRAGDGYILPDLKFDDYAITMLKGSKEFKYLGTGCDKTAFLHKDTGLVYKVVFARAGNGEYQRPYLKRYIEKEQELIAGVDDEAISKHGVRYAKNYFLESDGIPVIAQEYLSPEEYKPYNIRYNNPNLDRLLIKMGFSDMHGDNVMIHKKTGEIVLFDCLQLGGNVIGEVTGISL